jgi:hypothetical protein
MVAACSRQHYTNLQRYQRHWRQKHQPMFVFWRCPYCRRIEQVRNSLASHIRTTHSGRDPIAGMQTANREQRPNQYYVDPREILPPCPPSLVASKREVSALDRREGAALDRREEAALDRRGGAALDRREDAALERREVKEEADRLNLFPPAPTYISCDEVVDVMVLPGRRTQVVRSRKPSRMGSKALAPEITILMHHHPSEIADL